MQELVHIIMSAGSISNVVSHVCDLKELVWTKKQKNQCKLVDSKVSVCLWLPLTVRCLGHCEYKGNIAHQCLIFKSRWSVFTVLPPPAESCRTKLQVRRKRGRPQRKFTGVVREDFGIIINDDRPHCDALTVSLIERWLIIHKNLETMLDKPDIWE